MACTAVCPRKVEPLAQLCCNSRRAVSLKPSLVGGFSSNLAKDNGRRFSVIRSCVPSSPSGDTRADEGVAEESVAESESGDGKKRLSKQSSWEATDVLGNDYLYRLGKESDNMNITVGAKTGMVDSLFTGNFLGQEGEFSRLSISFWHLWSSSPWCS